MASLIPLTLIPSEKSAYEVLFNLNFESECGKIKERINPWELELWLW